MAEHKDPCLFCCLKGSGYLIMYLLECTRIRERMYKKTKATARKQLWDTFFATLRVWFSNLKLSVTMVTRTSDQDRGTRVKQARVTPLCHFCVSGIIIFFQYHIENFCRYYIKVSAVCDKYKRYWNNGVRLSNLVNGNTRVRT